MLRCRMRDAGFVSRKQSSPQPSRQPEQRSRVHVDNAAAVKATFSDEKAWIEYHPATRAMDFGYTFVVADPDGHRLRVFVPGPHEQELGSRFPNTTWQ